MGASLYSDETWQSDAAADGDEEEEEELCVAERMMLDFCASFVADVLPAALQRPQLHWNLHSNRKEQWKHARRKLPL